MKNSTSDKNKKITISTLTGKEFHIAATSINAGGSGGSTTVPPRAASTTIEPIIIGNEDEDKDDLYWSYP